MHIEPFRADHILELTEAQDAQVQDLALMLSDGSLGSFVQLERGCGMNYSVYAGEHGLVGCGGIFSIWPQRAQAWTMAAAGWHRHVPVHRVLTFARKLLESYPAARIEATTLAGFEPGHRWLRALGFTQEAALMRRYDPEGRDFSLYARVRE